jgi:hypothetical protein
VNSAQGLGVGIWRFGLVKSGVLVCGLRLFVRVGAYVDS